MIKVVNLISLLAAPLIVESRGTPASLIVMVVLMAILVWGIWQSKKEAVVEEVAEAA